MSLSSDHAIATSGQVKPERQRAIREIVARQATGSQEELAEQLRIRGFTVTQATVSRDIAELGLVKVGRGERHVYVSPADLGPGATVAETALAYAATDERLRKIVADMPVSIGRSGLVLLLIGTPGTASVLAQAIDESTMDEQEGTLAGDNTLLVLFRDEARLERWLERFRDIQGAAASDSGLSSRDASASFDLTSGRRTPDRHLTEASR
jgi:transcriptional regulator of arginine metabolism